MPVRFCASNEIPVKNTEQKNRDKNFIEIGFISVKTKEYVRIEKLGFQKEFVNFNFVKQNVIVSSRLFLLLLSLLYSITCFSQTNDKVLLQKLDSVKSSTSVASYFASIYLATTQNAIHFFSKYDQPVQQSFQRLESRFADYFFFSAEAYSCKKEIPVEWKDYYSNVSLSPLQYQLLGINAHINGDIWKALTDEFTLQEIKRIKKYYKGFNKGLNEIYIDVYHDARRSNPKIRGLHFASLGLDKSFGERMLYRWRKRQMQLAILYFTNSSRFTKRHKKLQAKMKRLNNMILHIL